MNRRAFFLSLLPAASLGAENARGSTYPSEIRRYADPATELELFRLTDPSHSSFLPSPCQHAISRRSSFLLYASDRTGSWQAYQMNLKTGESKQVTDSQALDTASLTLTSADRSFCYFDGPSLHHVMLGGARGREIYRVPEGSQRCPGFHVSEDGAHAVFGETTAKGSRLRMVTLAKGLASTVVDVPWQLQWPQLNPRRAQVLYARSNAGLYLVDLEGRQNRPLKMEPSAADWNAGLFRWSPQGRTVVYLRISEDKAQLNTLREHTPDENADKLIAKTSQFVQFGQNADSSVFVGASRNRASPTLLLLLRVTRREFTLCEHRAKDPSSVAPVFAPNSQSIFFQSDLHGKPAIYRIQVEKLVEETDAESSGI